ncbi:MAG: DCC1-like thiol-disulfide oxidoreductase family protein [Haloferacaceae archaeon]
MSEATLVYDDDCGFCTWWAEFLLDHADVRVVGFSELTDDLRARLPADYEECAHLLVDGEVHSCGASIEEALVRSDVGGDLDLRPLVAFLRHFEDYARLRERAYRAVADRRDVWGQFLSADPPARSERDDGN